MQFCFPLSFLFFLLPRFVAWPLELGLGTHNPRFVVWPLELGLGTHNPRLGILLGLVEGAKMGFHPVYTQNTQFFQANPIMDENQIGPNINTPVERYIRDRSYPSA